MPPTMMKRMPAVACQRWVFTPHHCTLKSRVGILRNFSSVASSSQASSTAYYTIPDDVAERVEKYAMKKQTSASLQTLMKTGRGELLGKSYKTEVVSGVLKQHTASERILLQVASFIRKEIPIRLAHRIRDLDQVPMMSDMPAVQAVKQIYVDSFNELSHWPKIQSVQDEAQFANRLETLYEKHSNVLVEMARGAFELRAAVAKGEMVGKYGEDGIFEFDRMQETHSFLDRFYTSRIGIRVLAGQYLALRHEPIPDYIGMICLKTSPEEIVRIAASDATMICERQYGEAPLVDITGRLDLTFAYIPTHLHYVLLELIKNAMKATMVTHGDTLDELPPVTIVIADGTENEDVVIKVSDEGGGIPRSQVKRVFKYLFTTADPKVQQNMIGGSEDQSTDTPLAGLGFGLPIARSYTRYFGGDLSIMSMEGHGTDAFVHLRRLGDSREPIPV